MDDPFGPSSSSSSSSNTVNNNNMTQSSASTSYTIMSPRAFASSPLLPTLLQKGSPIAAGAGATGSTSTSNASPGHQRQSSNPNSSIPISNMNISSPSSIMRPVSPPTPAPSPQPELEHGGIHAHVLHDGTAVNTGSDIQSNAASISTPLHPGSVLMAHSGSAAMGEPGTPVSPGTEDAPGLAWGNPNIHVHPSHFSLQEHDDDKQPAELNQHIDPLVQEALFVTQYIQSVVSYFPRLTGSERRTLFNSLLPYMAGEDLLYLSHLISPYLRRDFLAELPAEIALKILTFIDDPKDLVRASCVSRTWRSLVADEQNWKLMLEKYNGGNWTGARPALATTGIPSTSRADATGGRKTASSGRQQRQFVPEQIGLAGFNVPRMNSAVSPTSLINPAVSATAHLPGQRLANNAPASRTNIREYQPSYHQTQNAFYNLPQGGLLSAGLPGFNLPAPSSASSSTSHPMVAGASTSSTSSSLQPEDGREINRFLDENQTPLAERVRRNKGKGRALENAEDQPFARDLSSDGAMPGPSRAGTVGLVQMPVLDPSAARRTPVGRELHGLGVLPPRMGSVSGSSVLPPQPSLSAAAVLAAHQQQLSRQQARSAASSALPPPNAMLYPIPQSLAGQMQQLSLAGAVPPILPSLPVLDSNANRSTQSANTVPSTVSSAISPSATFQPAYVSPAQYAPSTLSSTPSVPFANRGAPSIIAADQTSPIFSRRPSYALPNQSQSAPQPARSRIAKSQNPFGTAQTNLSYTAQYQAGYSKANTFAQGANSAGKPFSYKTQFKKAYLTESNWLKGPGRVLSRQTCTDDGVVTSLGFDNEWIIVGMATNQIHLFDAKTGAYVQQLVGHSLGVWCLVLVSKGGQRVDKDGKKIKSPNLDGKTIPDVFRSRNRTSWEPEEVEDDSGSQDSSDEEQSPTMGRTGSSNLGPLDMEGTRSASARPADRERFFQEAPDSLSSSPSLLEPSDGSPRLKGKSCSRARRMSGEAFSSEPAKPKSNRRPSSFCGVPSSGPSGSQSGPSNPAGFASHPSGFPFGGDGTNISPQQAAACGTAQGWGQPGAVAVSGGCDRDVRVWDVATGRCIHLLRGHMSTVRCLKVLDGRPIAVSGSRDNTLRVWDIERGVLLHMLSGHQHSVRCIEISGNKVVSGSYDATCKVWDVDTGECLHTLQGHQHQIYAVAFDGNRVASGSLDSTVRIWSAKTGECLALLQGHTSLVGQLQLTDSLLVTGGSDGRVIVFSLSTFECLHRLCAHDNSVTCLQFNDRFMVTGGNDGRVKLWDRPSGKLIRDLAEPCEAVWRVTFREDKFVLLCKRGNRTIMEVRTFAPFEEEL